MASPAPGSRKSPQIAQRPVTSAEFAQFIRSGKYRDRQYWDVPPSVEALKADVILRRVGFSWPDRATTVKGVTWYEADAYCRAFGARLPYSDELEAWFSRSLRPAPLVPEWCGDYYNPAARGPFAYPTPSLQRRVVGWMANADDDFAGTLASGGAAPYLTVPGFAFRMAFEHGAPGVLSRS
jgi:hypothetical protein